KTTLISSTNPSLFGQSVTFTATVNPVAPGTGTPSGSVTFLDGATTLGTETLSGGAATFTTSALSVAGHPITASYGDDSTFNPSTSAVLTQTVNKGNATVDLSALNQIYDGAPRAVTANSNPSGLTVNVTYDGSVTPPTNTGSYSVVATVSDINYEG